MANKKKKKSEKNEVGEVVITALKEFLMPKVVKSVKSKIHSEFNYFIGNIEHKTEKITDHFINRFFQVCLLLISFLFMLFGGLYFFIDIMNIEKAYVLLCLGLILLIMVFIIGLKKKK